MSKITIKLASLQAVNNKIPNTIRGIDRSTVTFLPEAIVKRIGSDEDLALFEEKCLVTTRNRQNQQSTFYQVKIAPTSSFHIFSKTKEDWTDKITANISYNVGKDGKVLVNLVIFVRESPEFHTKYLRARALVFNTEELADIHIHREQQEEFKLNDEDYNF
ncbi:hypothetical protein [Lactococcus allomyrinae]|uniref:Uncharacterized protein n=1 Tax=Lactococcus allomyrinae TaxID=2419773 RepID=A0A387BFD3_9LACT|nr:hypothetical protein [Lactococcus allomyrinae]AYF99815.1 hypothetical protein D7I46_01170 [Lactococcus allomyrinae]